MTALSFMFSLPSFFWSMISEFSILLDNRDTSLLLFLCLYCVEGCLITTQLHFLWPVMRSDCIIRHPSPGLQQEFAAKPGLTLCHSARKAFLSTPLSYHQSEKCIKPIIVFHPEHWSLLIVNLLFFVHLYILCCHSAILFIVAVCSFL